MLSRGAQRLKNYRAWENEPWVAVKWLQLERFWLEIGRKIFPCVAIELPYGKAVLGESLSLEASVGGVNWLESLNIISWRNLIRVALIIICSMMASSVLISKLNESSLSLALVSFCMRAKKQALITQISFVIAWGWIEFLVTNFHSSLIREMSFLLSLYERVGVVCLVLMICVRLCILDVQ